MPEPSRPGKPDCPHCGGEGIVPVPPEGDKPRPPVVRMCKCILQIDILANVERGMRGLSSAPPVAKSPLLDLTAKNVWMTGSKQWFMIHLRHVAVRQPPTWGFKVSSDADLMVAWLATAAAQGAEILDPEIREEAVGASLSHLTLMDIAAPPALLVLRLGIKRARNVAMSEVLLEALTLREQDAKPTWVWDQPDFPLAEGHLCWSPGVIDLMSGWVRIRGDREGHSPNGGHGSSSVGPRKRVQIT